MNASITVELRVLNVNKMDLPILSLEFPESFDVALRAFDPLRLYLEPEPEKPGLASYGMVDEQRHRYCGVQHNEKWITTAEKLGGFFLAMKVELRGGQALGRLLLVRYPFGGIVRDSEIFQTDSRDFTTGLQDGTVFRKVARDLAARLGATATAVN